MGNAPQQDDNRVRLFSRQRLSSLLRALGVLAVVLVLLAALAIFLIPAEDRIETAWEQAPPATDAAGGDAGVGRVLVDVRFARGRGGNGQFVIEPIAAGEPIRVVAVFDQRAYVLEHGYVDGDRPGWTFRLRFERKRRFPINPHQYLQEVRLQLPRGLPLRIEGQVSWGESDLQLGGLSLLALDWQGAIGTHEIGFSEPLGVAMERLTMRGRIGSLQLRDLGRASPRVVELSHSIGDLAIDLEGPWATDASIHIDCLAANCGVRAPDAATLFFPGDRAWGEAAAPPRDVPLARLDLSVSRRLSSLDIGPGTSYSSARTMSHR